MQQWKKVTKLYNARHYFKQYYNQEIPRTPLAIQEYLAQHGELPFKPSTDNWQFEMHKEYQYRNGVYADQHYTPPEYAQLLADYMYHLIVDDSPILDACCGYGALTEALLNQGITNPIHGYDISYDNVTYYANQYGKNNAAQWDFTDGGSAINLIQPTYQYVASNPPFTKLPEFLEQLRNYTTTESYIAIITPSDYFQKTRPAKLEKILKGYCLHQQIKAPQAIEFSGTKIRTDINIIQPLPIIAEPEPSPVIKRAKHNKYELMDSLFA